MRIVAIDPGKMTGLASCELAPEDELIRVHDFKASALPYQDALLAVMDELMFAVPKLRARVVVMEDFIISERTAKVGSSSWKPGKELEFIGCVRWACARCDVEFVTQTPSQAKSFSTDAKLKRLDMWTKGLDHPRDATRHLVRWLAMNGHLDPRTLVGDA